MPPVVITADVVQVGELGRSIARPAAEAECPRLKRAVYLDEGLSGGRSERGGRAIQNSIEPTESGEIRNPVTDFSSGPHPAGMQTKPKNLQRLLIARGFLRFIVRRIPI